jgi:hypothetical protein
LEYKDSLIYENQCAITKRKGKYTIISNDAEKSFDKIQYHFNKSMCLNIISIYEEPSANIIVDDRRLKAFPLR